MSYRLGYAPEVKDFLENIPPAPPVPLASKIEHRRDFYSGDLMLNFGSLTIERRAYYIEGKNPEEAWERAKEHTAKAILAGIYAEIRPQILELLRELEEAPESKRRNRCLAYARGIAEILKG